MSLEHGSSMEAWNGPREATNRMVRLVICRLVVAEKPDTVCNLPMCGLLLGPNPRRGPPGLRPFPSSQRQLPALPDIICMGAALIGLNRVPRVKSLRVK
jgi:hypothetical protein